MNSSADFLLLNTNNNVCTGRYIVPAMKLGDPTYQNVAFGDLALTLDTIGTTAPQSSMNTAFGYSAMNKNTTGYSCCATGWRALASNTTGSNDTADGANSLVNCTTGSYNSGSGVNTLGNLTTANYNTAGGFNAGLTVTTGNLNTIYGSQADVDVGTRTGCLILGASAVPNANNQLVLGSATVPLNNATTVGAAGGASALPATPLGYISVLFNGVLVKIPYYNP